MLTLKLALLWTTRSRLPPQSNFQSKLFSDSMTQSAYYDKIIFLFPPNFISSVRKTGKCSTPHTLTSCLHLLRQFLTRKVRCIFSTRVIHFVCLKFIIPPAHSYLPLTWVGMLFSVEIPYYADWYNGYISALGAEVFFQLYLKMGFQRAFVVSSEDLALFQSVS